MTLLDASKTVASNIAGDNKVVNFGTDSKIRFGSWFLATGDQQPTTRNQKPDTRNQIPATRNQKLETRYQKPETIIIFAP